MFVHALTNHVFKILFATAEQDRRKKNSHDFVVITKEKTCEITYNVNLAC